MAKGSNGTRRAYGPIPGKDGPSRGHVSVSSIYDFGRSDATGPTRAPRQDLGGLTESEKREYRHIVSRHPRLGLAPEAIVKMSKEIREYLRKRPL